jgi:WhiB family redox-sensing transcriptional regulator
MEYDEMSLLEGFFLELKDNDFGWQKDANCKGADTEMFFMEFEEAAINHIKLREARKVCFDCTAKKECLDFAVVNNINYGVWGGSTPAQRKEIRHEQRHRV